MAYPDALWIYVVLVFGIIVVPGMVMLFVVATALTGGRRSGLAATGGIMAGSVAHTVFGATAVDAAGRVAGAGHRSRHGADAAEDLWRSGIGRRQESRFTVANPQITIWMGRGAGSYSYWLRYSPPGMARCNAR